MAPNPEDWFCADPPEEPMAIEEKSITPNLDEWLGESDVMDKYAAMEAVKKLVIEQQRMKERAIKAPTIYEQKDLNEAQSKAMKKVLENRDAEAKKDIQRILGEIHTQEQRLALKGVEAKRIYLGRDNFHTLMKSAEFHSDFRYAGSTVGNPKRKLLGMDLYMVDDNDHIAVY